MPADQAAAPAGVVYRKRIYSTMTGILSATNTFLTSEHHKWVKLNERFFRRRNVVRIARELVGKVLVTCWDGKLTAGRIVETEAYAGVTDRASHAFGGRKTARTNIMYGPPGTSYVYLCYGIHHLFNVVTNKAEIPHAILIRALEPLAGIRTMLERTGKKKADHTLTRGPGNLSRAMGLSVLHTGRSLFGNEIFIADDGFRPAGKALAVSERIGVSYAGKDARLPYRFYLRDNPFVSGRPYRGPARQP